MYGWGQQPKHVAVLRYSENSYCCTVYHEFHIKSLEPKKEAPARRPTHGRNLPHNVGGGGQNQPWVSRSLYSAFRKPQVTLSLFVFIPSKNNRIETTSIFLFVPLQLSAHKNIGRAFAPSPLQPPDVTPMGPHFPIWQFTSLIRVVHVPFIILVLDKAQIIKMLDEVMYLGVILDSRLTCNQHLQKIIRKTQTPLR
jgi:hypothetical protein